MAETFDETISLLLSAPLKLFHEEGDFSFITDNTLRESLTYDYDIFFNKLGDIGIFILKTNIKNFNVKQKGWHLDHIYSISDGWRNNIDPTIVGHFVNLRYVTAKENCTKNKKSDFTKETLYELYEQNK